MAHKPVSLSTRFPLLEVVRLFDLFILGPTLRGEISSSRSSSVTLCVDQNSSSSSREEKLGKGFDFFPIVPRDSAFKRPVDALEAAADEGASFFVCMDVEFAFFHRVDNFFRCHLW